MTNKIFGYDWEDIQRAQQGGRLSKPIDLSAPSRAELTQQDIELLAKHGEQGLRDMGYFGVLDRLERSKAP